MILVNTAIGPLTIPDIKLNFYNNEIKEIDANLPEVKKSMLAPNGGIYLSKLNNFIKIIRKGSKDYDFYKSKMVKQDNPIPSDTVNVRKALLKFFKIPTEEDKGIFLKNMRIDYYDFARELANKELSSYLRTILSKKLEEFYQMTISQKFELLDIRWKR